MKTMLLLPNGFKKLGWVIFVPAVAFGCSICLFDQDFSMWLFPEAVMNNIAIVGTVVGALMIGFSREKIEDEMIQRIRLNSLLLAVWINYLMLIIASLFLYGLEFFSVMACNMATTLVIFIVVYYFSLYRLKHTMNHEE